MSPGIQRCRAGIISFCRICWGIANILFRKQNGRGNDHYCWICNRSHALLSCHAAYVKCFINYASYGK